MRQSRSTIGWHGSYCAALGAYQLGTDEYEVTVTLKVRSHDLEDVVAHTFADPHCVAVRVQRAISTDYRIEAGTVPPTGEIAV